eukprot:PhM_4_TR16122/c8_g1_i1/m.101359
MSHLSEVQKKIEQVIATNPMADALALDGHGIDTLVPLMPLLAQLPRLRRLTLTNNNLTSLPDDMSALRGLEHLDVGGNPVQGLQAVIRGLFCLSSLKHLSIDLPLESDEDEVIVSLTSLESFNGTPLTEGGGSTPNPAAAPAAPLPPTHQQQQQQQQPSSQLPNNNNNVSSLRDRYGAQQPQQQPQAQQGRAASPGTTALSAKTRWDPNDMAEVQRLYQAANSVSGRIADKSEFEDYTRHIIAHLHTLLSGEDDPFRKETEILKAKKIMYEYCFDEISRSSYRFDANLSNVLHTVQETYNRLLEGYDRLIKNMQLDKDRKLEVMRTDMQHAIKEMEQLVIQLDQANGNAGNNSNNGAAAAAALAAQQQLETERRNFEAERQRLTEELGWLRTENEKLAARVRQQEYARPASSAAMMTDRSPEVASSANAYGSRTGGGGTSSMPQPRTPGGPGAPASSAGPQAAAMSVGKSLTLRQLKDVIEDIYASKSKFDIKCSETHLPRETMEQHMYTYLNQKYGLKHLILDWATAIIQGVRKYSPDDNDVAVFGKILRNEIDEEFRFVQRQLKETVHELLRVYLKGKHPLKGDEDILTMLRKRLSGSVLEDEWIDIVKYMYNAEDSVTIIMRIKEVLRQHHHPRRQQQGTPGRSASLQQQSSESTSSLPYSELLRVLLGFQLEGHERFLSGFVRLFRQVDGDRNGIINEFEFRNLVRMMDPAKSDEEVGALLDLIDPHNNQLINFSECVTFLSSELVRVAQREGSANAAAANNNNNNNNGSSSMPRAAASRSSSTAVQ